jgi:hypothetical protein
MAKTSPPPASQLLKEIRAGLDERVDEKLRAGIPNGQPKSPLKSLGVKTATVKILAKDVLVKHKAVLDYPSTVELLEAAVGRKIREEVLLAIELLERFRRDIEPALLARIDKWIPIADDLEVAEALGSRVASAALAADPARMATVRKWARMKSPGRKRVALLAAAGLVTEGRRDATLALDLCEILLTEDHPVLVSEVAALLRDTTKVDAKAVQDFLFRRSIDGNPEILRAGSENLDAARRAALIAKLEAQAATAAPVGSGGR